MFRTRVSRLTAAALCLVALGAPLMGAGIDGWGKRHGRSSPQVVSRVEVNIGFPSPFRQPVVVRHGEEVLPGDLRLTAYQSGDTVIVVATGTNRSTGFNTAFVGQDVHDRSPELRLMNTSRGEPCAQVLTAFEVSASFHTRHRVECIRVIVAGRAFDVHAVQTPSL